MRKFWEVSPTPRSMRQSLASVAETPSLRLDAKQSEARFIEYLTWIEGQPHFVLGDFLPDPVTKGAQPLYTDDGDTSVITTMAVRQLYIDTSSCRMASYPAIVTDGSGDTDYEADPRRPRWGDVLLTVDGGSSIGKSALFELDGDYAVDSHVAILRPVGLDPTLLVYLLASPFGQLQFQKAESGASGQTAVTEEELRRFRFPALSEDNAQQAIDAVRASSARARRMREEAAREEESGWDNFVDALAPGFSPKS